MHIPKGASQTCDLLTFADALHCPQHDDYDAARWLYVPPYYTEYRYILGTRGANPLICIGINPSTAQPGDLDNTLKSVERIALGNGYDSFTMFNVYPQRATDPNAMDTTFNRALHEQNILLWVSSSTWVSMPMTTSYSMMQIDDLQIDY